jgi:nucleotide-binding universal stress UspA family protein
MTIVYSFDFSEASTECASAAAAMAARLAEPLLLTYVIDPKIPSLPPELEAKLDFTIRARLDSFASQLRASQPQAQVSAVELRGDPVDELIAFAHGHARLLILASPGHRDASRRVISVSEKVAHGATVPVLVMREPGPWLDWAAGRRSLRAVLGVSRDASCAGAIELATRVRAAARCDVIATEVYFAPEIAAHYGLTPPAHWLEQNPELEELLTRDLAKRISALGGAGDIRLHPNRGVGPTADQLIDVAERERADVIITGRHSRPQVESVSDSLIHNGRMALLIAPNQVPGARFEAFPRLRRILAATDLSAFGNQAVRAGATLAQAIQGELHLFHVADTQVPSWYEEASIVAKLRQLLPERWALPVSTEVIFGRDPAVAIAGAAERIDADTICVASHARGGLSRVALGSVTEELLKATHRPVLVVRPSEE